MKKNVLLLFVLMLLPMVASADAVEIDGIYYNLISKGGNNIAEVTANPNNYFGSIEVPEIVKHEEVTYSVTSIGSSAFVGCKGLTSVTIPNSVTSIGEGAFRSCKGLISVTIGNGVTRIGREAFSNCSGLTSVHITDLEAWCEISFGFSSNPLMYANHLFLNGEEIKDLVIPNSVTSIGDYVFEGCFGLTSISIPNSVTSIGDWSFEYCWGLTSVTIPNNVISIGEGAFYECRGLTSIIVPNNVTSIGDQAFEYCFDLTSVTIGNSVTSIGRSAFRCCEGLTSITIGSEIKTIGALAFAGCKELADVYCYAEKVPSTQSDAFENSYIEYATLHVPEVSLESYKSTKPWSGFGTIVPLESSGVEAIDANGATISNYFTLDGQRIEQPRMGVNIVRMSDGTVKKVVIK